MNLENLDTLIGFAVVILLLSLLITSLVQLAGMLLRLRGKNLLWGIERTIEELAPGTDAKTLAVAIVEHRSIKPTSGGSATAIHFDEFVGIARALITEGPLQGKYEQLLAALDTAPIAGVTTLATALEAELSQRFPQEVARVEEGVARAKQAALAAGARARFWFDAVMDRTTERFVAHTRLITMVCAVGLAFGVQVDSLDLLGQLSRKHDVRAKLVQMADPVLKQADVVLQPRPASSDEELKKQVASLASQVSTLRGQVSDSSLVIVPDPYRYDCAPRHLLGMLMSAFFLSLGAPFWFNTLSQLSNLRPILAGKVEAKDEASG
jgi:hypothetical protein